MPHKVAHASERVGAPRTSQAPRSGFYALPDVPGFQIVRKLLTAPRLCEESARETKQSKAFSWSHVIRLFWSSDHACAVCGATGFLFFRVRLKVASQSPLILGVGE